MINGSLATLVHDWSPPFIFIFGCESTDGWWRQLSWLILTLDKNQVRYVRLLSPDQWLCSGHNSLTLWDSKPVSFWLNPRPDIWNNLANSTCSLILTWDFHHLLHFKLKKIGTWNKTVVPRLTWFGEMSCQTPWKPLHGRVDAVTSTKLPSSWKIRSE